MRLTPLSWVGLLGIVLALARTSAAAQVPSLPTETVIDGPAAPQFPGVISRDATGNATVRAARLAMPLAIGGDLSEDVYAQVLAISGFLQFLPVEGAPASERTDVWVLFDEENLYISTRCWDSSPESQWVANEMRRDSFNIVQNEHFVIFLDTFYDRRSGIILTVNPLGGGMDGQMSGDSGQAYNGDWNPIWDVRTGRFEDGWTLEAAIPFKSIRYRPGRTQTWGVNFQRHVRWKNELSALTQLQAARGGPQAIFQASLAGSLVGLEAPEAGGRNLEVKPFIIADRATDRAATPSVSNALNGDVGLDVKYGITENLVADLTINSDFAQVEADEQQVNLTRFSLFFPQKREFFLEDQTLFAFGGAGVRGTGNTPVMFYSRRIGLNQGREVPIDVGGRATGRLGRFSVGLLNIQTGNEPAAGARSTNFSVVRVKRDLLRHSSIGAIFTRRSLSAAGPGSNETYGLDGTFAFYDNVNVNTYWAKTHTQGMDDDVSDRGQFSYTGDRYGVEVERLVVGSEFNPEVGFLCRDDFERSFGLVRFSPRPRSIAAVRKFSCTAHLDYLTDRAGLLETREAQGRFEVELENADKVDVRYTRSYEFLKRPFSISRSVTIPVGGYSFPDVRGEYAFGPQRRLAGRLSFQHGGFFGGDLTTFGAAGGRLEVTPSLSIEPGMSFNWSI